MANFFGDCVLESSTSEGTADLALLGALAGYEPFSGLPGIAVGDYGPYAAWGVDASGNRTGEWESGICVYSAADTLQRYLVRASSNNNEPVVFSAGTKYVACSLNASDVQRSAHVFAQFMNFYLP